MNAQFLKLGIPDWAKAFILTVITSVLTTAYTALQAGSLPDLATLKTAILVGVGSGVSYLLKNVLTNSEGKFLSSEK